MKQSMRNHLVKTFSAKKDYIYLAGPFFNPVQLAWARNVAKLLRSCGFKVWAPVDEVYQEKCSLDAAAIFKRNIMWLENTKFVLAQLDYPLINNRHMGILTMNNTGIVERVQIPDSGTVWEMGYAFAKEIPVIGYSKNSVSKINLMLTQAMIGHASSIGEMFSPGRTINWNRVTEYEGIQT